MSESKQTLVRQAASIRADMDQHLFDRIQPVLKRANWLRFFNGLSLVWMAAAVVALSLLVSNYSGGSYFVPGTLLPVLGGLFLLATLAWLIWSTLTRKSSSDIAQVIENHYEELDSSLMTAIEQRPDEQSGLYNFLQYDVIRKAVYHSYRQPWRTALPVWRSIIAPLSAVASLVAFVGFLGLYWYAAKPIPIDPHVVDFSQVASGDQNYSLVVEPGDAAVEAGSSLMVLARFGEQLPPEATVVFQPNSSNAEAVEEIRIPMSKSLADPIFGCRIPEISGNSQYRVDYAGRSSDTFQVTVFRYPKLVRSDAELDYPDFTKLADKTVQNVRRVAAVTGTELTLKCYLNKSVAAAKLRSADGTEVVLEKGDEQNLYQVTMTLAESRKFRLLLTDRQGRENKSPAQLSIKVLRNRQVELKLLKPVNDLQASPLEEIDLLANAWDDFGVTKVGLAYSIGGAAPSDIVIGENLPGKKQNEVKHLLALESLSAQPDQLVSYHFWAEDFIGTNQIRRTVSDMYFAEVRHFEEIFRQGQAQPGGQQPPSQAQGQNAQQAQALGELQKQIMNATWRIIRNETGTKPSDQFADDAGVIRESQENALEQLAQLTERVEDPGSQQIVQQVRDDMQDVIQGLSSAIDRQDLSRLKGCLSSEQKAYQGLLHLRAQESQVSQQNQNQMPQSGQQNSRSQQQMNELELEEDENRYETERLAQSEQNAQQQEDRQVLSRLRELARRQNDLNERIKELQSALDEAKDDKERDEIERELKRLQEEQEQILRDAEELQDRMESEQNQERMSQAAQQLEEARENIRKANEALQEGELTQAAAEGTRAEREIRELRDEFQQRTSSQFAEEMREMRDAARELEDDQERISEELRDLERNPQERGNSLTEGDPRQDLTSDLGEQQEKIEELQERIRQTVEEAEDFEPLLAEELYDTYRRSVQDRPNEALEAAEQWLRRGFDQDARAEQQTARESVERIREGVDKAAERVLGDETEALRRANRELERLKREIDQEAKQESGDLSNEIQPDEDRPGENKPDERSPDENSPGENKPRGNSPGEDRPGKSSPGGNEASEDEPGETRPGENSPGENSPGEDRPGGQDGRPDLADNSQQRQGDASGFGGGQSDPVPAEAMRPLTGEDFMDWSDRLRDVEEMVPDQKMRAEATRIRENAREFRQQLKRHSKEPNWDLVKLKVIEPLAELQRQVSDELIRRSASDEIVPVDRDPVPLQYEEAVRKYYEQLGTGK